MLKRLFMFSLLLFVFPAMNTYAAYEVDTDFLYKEESIYQVSKWTLDLTYDKDTTENSSVSDTVVTDIDIKTNIGATQKIERPLSGYWFDGSIDFTYTKTQNDSGADQVDKTYKIKQFEGIYEGFLQYDYCDTGIKRYLSEQSPIYIFGQGLFYWKNEVRDNDSSEDKKTEMSAGCGIGYGKIVDLGSYQRILVVQNELIAAGLVKQKFQRSTILKLLPFFRKAMDKNERLMEVQTILVNEGLIDKKNLTLDIANDILDAIDESFEKREYGFEIRGGYLQDLVHRDKDEEKLGRMNVYVKYEKPLSEIHQLTLRGDYFKIINSDKDEDEYKSEGTEIQLTGFLSSQISAYLNSEVGITYVIKKDLAGAYADIVQKSYDDTDSTYYPEGKSIKLYGEMNYEITDVITWENGISYTTIKPDASSKTYDKQKTIEVTSKLTYSFW